MRKHGNTTRNIDLTESRSSMRGLQVVQSPNEPLTVTAQSLAMQAGAGMAPSTTAPPIGYPSSPTPTATDSRYKVRKQKAPRRDTRSLLLLAAETQCGIRVVSTLSSNSHPRPHAPLPAAPDAALGFGAIQRRVHGHQQPQRSAGVTRHVGQADGQADRTQQLAMIWQRDLAGAPAQVLGTPRGSPEWWTRISTNSSPP